MNKQLESGYVCDQLMDSKFAKMGWFEICMYIAKLFIKKFFSCQTIANMASVRGTSGSLEIELGVHRIHDTLETGLQTIPRSLVPPH